MHKFIYTMLCVFLGFGAEAVIVAGGDGMQNTNSPAGGQGWDYVGRITSANNAPSGVTYISNNWFITAYHIKTLDNPTGVLLGGEPYTIDPNSWTRLQNSTSGDADLIMFRVVGETMGLPGLTVRSLPTVPTSELTMVGNGRNRQTSETHWNALWTEVTPPPPSTYSGYKWASGATKRWGTNKKTSDVGLVNTGYGITDMFTTTFDDMGGNEAQAATYDSGGGVFYNNAENWELAGIMLAVASYGGQPSGTAVYGNLSYIANMQYYAAQISSTAGIDDIDEDGIPDGWEYEQTGSTTGVVAAADQDEDGFTGEEEWIADTDPNNSNSFFRVSDYLGATNMVFSSSTNREYQVQFLTNLTNTTWATEIDWFGGSLSQTVQSVSAPTSNRFYRIRVQLQ